MGLSLQSNWPNAGLFFGVRGGKHKKMFFFAEY